MLLVTAAVIPPVSAHCPLCTAGAAAGVAVARAFGVDDAIVGLWLGAFVAASALWIDRLLIKRGIRFPLQGTLLVAISLLALAIPLYYAGIITNTGVVKSMPDYHSVLGMEAFGLDRLFSGLVVGTILIAGVFTISDSITAKRGRRLFDYQGMILMAATLVVTTTLLWITAG
ncbi:MAG: hypothetical protein ABSB80_04265 [Methanoregula sp.]|uniref:hypothetical protein n=1 Tax=Methanoregula sp. TaxID=2052170 RepID=UPI003D0F40B2